MTMTRLPSNSSAERKSCACITRPRILHTLKLGNVWRGEVPRAAHDVIKFLAFLNAMKLVTVNFCGACKTWSKSQLCSSAPI